MTDPTDVVARTDRVAPGPPAALDSEHVVALIRDRLHPYATEPYGDLMLNADRAAVMAVAALLAASEVRERFGCRLTWPDGTVEDHWGDGSRALAEKRVALHRARRPAYQADLVRRIQLTLSVETIPLTTDDIDGGQSQ